MIIDSLKQSLGPVPVYQYATHIRTSATQVEKKKRWGEGRFLYAKLMITPTGKQAPQQ